MGDVVTAEVLEWARDIALINRLLAGKPIAVDLAPREAVHLDFAARNRRAA